MIYPYRDYVDLGGLLAYRRTSANSPNVSE
jgi:hypothetical protein